MIVESGPIVVNSIVVIVVFINKNLQIFENGGANHCEPRSKVDSSNDYHQGFQYPETFPRWLTSDILFGDDRMLKTSIEFVLIFRRWRRVAFDESHAGWSIC